jgi:malic enzyme
LRASAARSPTIQNEPGTLTIKKNAVAVVTDGTAVLGLGDIGPEAALPVMEGKAILFKEFGDVDAWPVCLATTGLSGPGAVTVDGIRSMADNAVVFAMANPTPEIAPEEVEDLVAVMGTGRSDYPNQINNVLVSPGLFRGALDVRATAITEGMKLAAALALANVVPRDHLAADYVLPSVLDRDVAPAIADAVARAAIADGVARAGRDEPPIA